MVLEESQHLILNEKSYLKHIPIRPIGQYDDSSKEMAIVIPLFGAPLPNESAFSDKYVHSSVAAYRSLLLNTDIVRRKIPVYFFVDDTIPHSCIDMLVSHGVKADRIIIFRAGPTIVKRWWTSRTFHMLKAPELMQFEHVVKWDADLFACCHPSIKETLSTFIFQSHNIGVFYHEPFFLHYSEIPGWWHRWDNSLDDIDDNWEITKQSIASVMDIKVEGSRLSSIASTVVSYPMKQLPEGFVDFCLKLTPVVGSEELVLVLWCQYANRSLCSINPHPVLSHFLESRELKSGVFNRRFWGAYWAHFYMNELKYYKDGERAFHQDIGALEMS